MNKKQIVFGALLGLPTLAMADAKISFNDLVIAKGETKTVTVNLELTDATELSGFDLVVTLPENVDLTNKDQVNYKENTDYGWTVTRSQVYKDLAKTEPVARTYRFVGFDKTGQNKLTAENAKNLVAIHFDVTASATFDAYNPGKIVAKNMQFSDVDTDDLKAEGISYTDASTVEGTIEGIWRLHGDYATNDFTHVSNVISVNDGLKEEQKNITFGDNHTQTFMLELTNGKLGEQWQEVEYYDPKDKVYKVKDYDVWGDPEIRSVEGYIHLPLGLEIKSFQKTNRTQYDDVTLGVPNDEFDEQGNKIGTFVKFIVMANDAPLRDVVIYGEDLFSFEVKANSEFTAEQAQIVIDNFIAMKYHDTHRYTMQDGPVTIIIDNPNQVEKNKWDGTVGKKDDAANPDGSLWAKYNAQVEIVNDKEGDYYTVRNSEKVNTAKEAAEAAINAIAEYNSEGALTKGELKRLYDLGVLGLDDDLDGKTSAEILDALKEAALTAIDKIVGDEGDGADNALADAKKYAEKAEALIENAAELDVPDNINQYETITPIKDERNTDTPNAGSLKNAKDELKKYYDAAKENGTLGDNKAEVDGVEKQLSTLEEAVDQLNNELAKQIGIAQERAKANEDLVTEALKNVPVEVPGNIAADDTEGKLAAAKAVYDAAKDALTGNEEKEVKSVVDLAAGAGKQADQDIYAEAIKAYNEAVQALNEAIATVKAEAEKNNKAATDAIAEYALPGNVTEDDGALDAAKEDGTWHKAKAALEQAVKDAEKAGTQAQDGIYDEEIAALKKAQEDVINTAKANNQAIRDKAVEMTYNAMDISSLGYDDVKANEDVMNDVNDFNTAFNALETAIENAQENGIEARTDVYKKAMDAIDAAWKTLVETIKAKKVIADGNADLVKEELDKTYDPQDRFDEIKKSNNIPDLLEDYEEAYEALEKALQSAKDNGLLADNKYMDEEGNVLDLADAIKACKDAREALDKAIDEATKLLKKAEDIVENDVLKDLAADLLGGENSEGETVEGELQKAKVADYYDETRQKNGEITPANWKENYDQLLADLQNEVQKVANGINNAKNEFLKGNITKEQLADYLSEESTTAGSLCDLLAKAFQNAENQLEAYLKTTQRGDVNGDGRWTSADYAQLRKVILDESYPKAQRKSNGDIVATEDGTSSDVYMLARMDINQIKPGVAKDIINVGDAQAALNYAFYGSMTGPTAARANSNAAEALSATMNGNVIAVSLQNSRQYSALQMDVVLPEGMTIASQSLGSRNEGFNIAANQLGNGATRIVVTAAEAGKAFEGNEGEVLYIEVAGQGTVEFQNIIFADLNAGTTEFQLNAVSGGTATGIAAAKNEGGMMQTIYNMGGRLMNGLKKGINIIRRADGTTEKVIKK